MLISPLAIGHPDWLGQWLPVSLTKAQVEKSPDIDTRKPVSRQQEADYFGYYAYPYYWEVQGLWGMRAAVDPSSDIMSTRPTTILATSRTSSSTSTRGRFAI